VIPNVALGEPNAIVVGSVGCSNTPVSPVIPFNVMVTVLPAGGIIVTALGVEPPAGGVIRLNPLAQETKSD
jgi:hypothetical protein